MLWGVVCVKIKWWVDEGCCGVLLCEEQVVGG